MLNNPSIFPDWSYYKNVGTTPNELWYLAGGLLGTAPVTASLPINELCAIPFNSGRGGVIDRIAFEVTTVGAAGSVARIGIYNSTNDDNLYPSTLVVDGGEFDTSATGGIGVKSSTISVTLLPNKIYWVVYFCGTAAPAFRRPASATSVLTMGVPPTLSAVTNLRLTVGLTYAALPATYPTGANTVNGLFGVWMRFAS